MRKERVRSKHGFKGFGVFILGWFIGLISTLGILFGVGYWAYTSISVKRIEKWTKNEITDNQGLEDLTLRKAVTILKGVVSNNDTNAYTIGNLEEDFNIKILGESIYGISTDIIKNSPIKQLKQAITDTMDTATFNNVLNFLGVKQEGLGLLNTVLETEVTYYIRDGKLYTHETDNIEVEFENYTINENDVEFANGTHQKYTKNGVVYIKPLLSDLPLNAALNSMTDATKDLKIYEVMGYERAGEEGNYTYTDNGVKVTGILESLAEYTVGELSDSETFNSIYIYEVMGYDRTGTENNYVYTKDGSEITGVMKAIAGKTIGELSKDETIKGIYVYEAMGYERTGEEGNYTYKYNNSEVTGAMKAIAGKTIGELSNPDTINKMPVYEIMGYTRSGTEGNYKYTKNNVEVTGVMKAIAGKTVEELSNPDTINKMPLYEVLGYDRTGEEGNYTYTNNGEEVTGAMKALANKTIDELSDPETINSLHIYEIMGYTRTGTEGNYQYFNGNDEVTGFMKAVAGSTINGIDTTINTLKATDLFDKDTTTILNLFTDDELKTLTVMDLPNAVTDKINDENMTIGKLVDCGVLKVTDDHGNPVIVSDTIRMMTVSELIQFAMQWS